MFLLVRSLLLLTCLGSAPAAGASTPPAARPFTFSAEVRNGGVTLHWDTGLLHPAGTVSVTRSADGRTYAPIATLAVDTTAGIHTFRDPNPLATTAYYRLLIVDRNGSRAYSDVQSVARGSGFGVALYPNPLQGETLELRLSGLRKPEILNLLVYDLGGRLVHRSTLTARPYAHATGVSLTVPSGTYTLRLQRPCGAAVESRVVVSD